MKKKFYQYRDGKTAALRQRISKISKHYLLPIFISLLCSVNVANAQADCKLTASTLLLLVDNYDNQAAIENILLPCFKVTIGEHMYRSYRRDYNCNGTCDYDNIEPRKLIVRTLDSIIVTEFFDTHSVDTYAELKKSFVKYGFRQSFAKNHTNDEGTMFAYGKYTATFLINNNLDKETNYRITITRSFKNTK